MKTKLLVKRAKVMLAKKATGRVPKQPISFLHLMLIIFKSESQLSTDMKNKVNIFQKTISFELSKDNDPYFIICMLLALQNLIPLPKMFKIHLCLY